MIHTIGQATTRAELPQALIQAFKLYYDALVQLRSGNVRPDQLVINGKISYALDAYKVTTASVRAARQLEAAGISVRPGMRIRFLFTTGEPDVFAWDTGDFFDPARLDKAKYIELLAKTSASVFLPFGIDSPTLQEWSQTGILQLALSI